MGLADLVVVLDVAKLRTRLADDEGVCPSGDIEFGVILTRVRDLMVVVHDNVIVMLCMYLKVHVHIQ